MGVATSTSGQYGEVLEHSLIRGLYYMVIGPSRIVHYTVGHTDYDQDHFWAVVIADESGMTVKMPTGEISEISGKGWIIHE